MCTDEYGKFDTIQLHVFIIHTFVYTGQLHSMAWLAQRGNVPNTVYIIIQ